MHALFASPLATHEFPSRATLAETTELMKNAKPLADAVSLVPARKTAF